MVDYCSVTTTQGFGNCLMYNFKLDELLILKKSLDKMAPTTHNYEAAAGVSQHFEDQAKAETGTTATFGDCHEQPQRLALMAEERSGMNDQYNHYGQPHRHQPTPDSHHLSSLEEKPSKLQTLFQISITALAFLSFGGYLLCLIVQAIKSKGTTYFHPVATTATASANGNNVKRIKVYRRGRRSVDVQEKYNIGIL